MKSGVINRIIYCSGACSKNVYKRIFESQGKMPQMQSQKYNLVMIHGFSRHDEIDFKVVSRIPIDRNNYKKNILKSFEDQYCDKTFTYISQLNIPRLGRIWQYFSMCNYLRKYANANTVVILDALSLTLGLATKVLKKRYKYKTIGLVTDLPTVMNPDIKGLKLKLINALYDSFDGYILLTEAMNDIINPYRKKPFIVVEGQVDTSEGDLQSVCCDMVNKKGKNDKQNRVCMFAGTVDYVNGVIMLARAFAELDIPNIKLHVYGTGCAKDDLIEIAKNNPNIVYFGQKPNDIIVEAEKEATLLINPRPINQKLVKYSFPSKVMEYMLSGTPVLTSRLPGMPQEYHEHVFFIDNVTELGIKEALEQVLKMEDKELNDKGMCARRFVLENKADYIQAGRIIEFAKQL